MRGKPERGPIPGTELVRTALLACLIAALLVSGVAFAASMGSVQLGPRVGDFLVFKPNPHLDPSWQVNVTRSADNTHCSLKPAAITSGSMVVERRLADGNTYLAHWAGPHTSAGSGDCGNEAELKISRGELVSLSEAIGGPGVSSGVRWLLPGF